MSDIATALKIAEASKEAVHNPIVMGMGKLFLEVATGSEEMPSDEVLEALYKYSAVLSSVCATIISEVLLTESQLDDMLADIQMFEDIEKEVLGE